MRFLLIKPPQKNEYTIANSIALFSSLITKTSGGGLLKMFGLGGSPSTYYSFNFITANQTIYFVAGAPDSEYSHLKNQLLAQYGRSDTVDLNSFEEVLKVDYESIDYGDIVPAQNYYIPIKCYDGTDADPLASILSTMSRSPDPKSFFWVQCIIQPANSAWQNGAINKINKLNASETVSQSKQTEIAMIQEKIKYHGFHVNIRVITDNPANTNYLQSAFTIFSRPGGNRLKFKRPNFLTQKSVLEAIKNHTNKSSFILNTNELATIWHLPNKEINIPNISWGKKLVLDTPENIPIAFEGMTAEEKQQLTFMGKTEYKNREVIFGIRARDRLRHVYIVGKTGSGKSWLINNMAIEDIRKGYGVAVLDPHGDAVDTILQYIPKSRINDVCYFNPSDPEYSYPLNVLEVTNQSQKELIVSGIIGIFYKLYAHSWGPRMEHILRNVLFTLVYAEDTTLPDIVRVLSDKKYRNQLLQRVDDPLIHQFWKNEFEGADSRFVQESISPILNKVGQFITSPMIRKIIAYQKSKVRISEIMDNKKIFLCDLSQGKLGEDNAALLGSMLITQIQISAMNRAFIPEEQRVPFYLYVDEFQNFATKSFTKILSEARKYKLGLTLANQYITQIDEEVMGGILGNIGNISTFNIGAKDADILYREFGNGVEPEDLTTMNKFQMLTRITVDNAMTDTFSSYSLPLPKNISGHQDKIIEQSRKRYGIYLPQKVREKINIEPTETANLNLDDIVNPKPQNNNQQPQYNKPSHKNNNNNNQRQTQNNKPKQANMPRNNNSQPRVENQGQKMHNTNQSKQPEKKTGIEPRTEQKHENKTEQAQKKSIPPRNDIPKETVILQERVPQ